MHQQSDGVTMESPLGPLIETGTWIIGTMSYMKVNLKKHITELIVWRMMAYL